MKRKFFIMTSGIPSFKKEKMCYRFLCAHYYPWPIQVIKSHSWNENILWVNHRHVCVDGLLHRASLRVNDEPDAAKGATPGVTVSESWSLWSMASWKKQATTKKYNGAYKRSGPRKKKKKEYIYNHLIVRLYIQFQESALSWQWLAEWCWKVTKLFMLWSFSIYKIT